MKRFVLILPSILSLGFICAADQEKSASSSPVVSAVNNSVSKQEVPLIFHDPSFFNKNEAMLENDFIKWVRNEKGDFTSQLKREIKNHSSILPSIEIKGWEDSGLSSDIRALGYDDKGYDKKLNFLTSHCKIDTDFSTHEIHKDYLEKVEAFIEKKAVHFKVGLRNESGVYFKDWVPAMRTKSIAEKLLLDPYRAFVWVAFNSGAIVPFCLKTLDYLDNEAFTLHTSTVKTFALHDNGNILLSVGNQNIYFYDIKDKSCRVCIDPTKMTYEGIYAGQKNLAFSHAIKATLFNGRYQDADLCIKTPLAYIKNKAFDTKRGALFMFGLYLASINRKFEDLMELREERKTVKKDEQLVSVSYYLKESSTKPLTAEEVLNYLYNSEELRSCGEDAIKPALRSMIEIKAKDYKVDLKYIV